MAGVPIPLQDPVVYPPRENLAPGQKDDRRGRATDTWVKYWQSQADVYTSVPMTVIDPVELTAQSASIGTTPFATGTLAAGLYYVDYYARITVAATTSSSLTVTIGWTDGTISQSVSGAAITGNTTASSQSGRPMINIDGGTSVTYSTTYASVGGTPMQYMLSLVLSKVP